MPALPAVGTTRRRAPPLTARVTAAERPRALKEPVGLVPSSLRASSGRPYFAPRCRSSTSGVPPSPPATGGSPSAGGRRPPAGKRPRRSGGGGGGRGHDSIPRPRKNLIESSL